MAEHKCNTCFYKAFDEKDFPCVACENYDSYVNYMAYQPVDTKTISVWDEEDSFDGYYGGSEDYVQKANDAVHSPKHYTSGKYEVIDVIEDWDLNFRLANAIKYIARHKHKGKPLEDLKKAAWYLQREIDKWSLPSKN